MVDFPRQNLLPLEQWIINWVDTGVDKPPEDLLRDTEQKYSSTTLWVPHSFIGFEMATTSALFQFLGILSRCKQEARNLRNWDFKAAPVWTFLTLIT